MWNVNWSSGWVYCDVKVLIHNNISQLSPFAQFSLEFSNESLEADRESWEIHNFKIYVTAVKHNGGDIHCWGIIVDYLKMSLAHKQRGSSSTQFLVTDGDNESQGRNTRENLPALGLNAPVLTGENNSQAAGDLSAGLPQVKPLENGNYQRSFSLESSRVTPRSARVSSSSSATAGLYTPFPGFQIPNETIIPKEDPATVVKRKQTISAKDAIPVLPRPVAIVCLIFNILIPGSGKISSIVLDWLNIYSRLGFEARNFWWYSAL